MRILMIFFLIAFIAASGQSFADVYDEVRIKECIRDNQDQGDFARPEDIGILFRRGPFAFA